MTAEYVAEEVAAWRDGCGDLEVSAARELAAQWHGGQWSALYSYASAGVIRTDLADEVRAELADATDARDRDELGALLSFVEQPVFVVWSSYGHHFMHADEDTYTCMRCGAAYDLRPDGDDRTHGDYVTVDGSEPDECTGDEWMAHGYPGERVCDGCDGEGCDHCNHDCPCLLCNS